MVEVRHDHIQEGGHAIIDTVKQGGGSKAKNEDQPHAKQFALIKKPEMWCQDEEQEPCRSPAVNGKRRCRMHGAAQGSVAPAGNRNALKHGGYTREALEMRSHGIKLARDAKVLIEDVG